MVLTVRDVRGLAEPRAARHQRPTGRSRLGTAEVDSLALVAQPEEPPPCKRQVARSNRRRGHHQTCRVRLDGRGHRALASPLLRRSIRGRWVRSTRERVGRAAGAGRRPSAKREQSRARRQNKKPSSSSRFEGGNRPQRLGGAGTRDRMDFIWGCSSTRGRAAALQAAGCRFALAGAAGQDVAKQRAEGRARSASNPVTSTNSVASLTQRPECRPV
jgi:hypothetical protein